MKFSKQREMIYNRVLNFPVHPTADQVYTALKTDNPSLSLGTVYRNLNLLSEMGMLLKIRIADGSDRFDGRTDDHYHMVCSKCDRVYDIELNELDTIKKVVADKYGHSLTTITLNLSGVCCDCMKSETITE
ncbi:MAG: transcriptional repressor [Oscillospiraceae bacterium]